MTTKNQFGPEGWTPELIDSLKGKTFVITGASAGAGFEASRILLSKGGKVIMLNRNAQKTATAIEALKTEFGSNADVSFIRLELGDLASVRDAAAEVLEKVGSIDALICNAAIAQVAKRELTVDGAESQLGVNHYGHFLLQALLFDRINESKGRIVIVGSEGYKLGKRTILFDDMNWDTTKYTPNDAYSQSKLAQIMIGYELQNRIKAANKDVKVYVCHPGASATSLIGEKTTLMMRFVWWLMTLSPMVQSAEKGSYPEVMCATQDDLDQQGYYGPTKRSNWVGPVGECKLEPHAKDLDIATRLWTVSEEKTGQAWSV